ncbi:MAG: hypothetical protein RLZZ557_2117 [Bacteroidota bacterium]
MFGRDFRTDNDSSYGEAIAHSFGHGVNIGINTCEIMAEELSGTAIAALYTVCYINGTVMVALLSNGLQESIVCNIDSTNALDTFNDDSRYLIAMGTEVVYKRFRIVERQEVDIVCLVYRRYNTGIVCCCYSQGCPAMKSLFEGHNFLSAGME